MSLKLEISKLLLRMPGTHTVRERKTLLTSLGFEHIGNRISFEGGNVVFFGEFLSLLYPEGKSTFVSFLIRLLESNWLGLEDQQSLRVLIEDIQSLTTEQWNKEFLSFSQCLSDDIGLGKKVVPHNLPQPDYEKFIGREEEKKKIIAQLRPYPDSRNSVITIDGIGGIGKSALALETGLYYLNSVVEERERFDAIVWASAKTSILRADRGIIRRRHSLKTLTAVCREIAKTLELGASINPETEEGDEFILRELSKRRVLLIIDNFETIDDDEVRNFLDSGLKAPSKVIVTTRHRIDVAYPIRLFGMSENEGQQLIEQECSKNSLALSREQKKRIFKRTGGVPLAIIWTIAHLSYGKDFKSTLVRLANRRSDIAKFCFREIVDNIKNKDSYKILLSLALCKGCSNRRELRYISGFESDEIGFDEGIEELQKLSLVSWKEGSFVMLPLTKEYVKPDLQAASKFASQAQDRLEEYDDFIRRNYNVIILGASGSGKTVFLAALFKQLSIQGNHGFYLEAEATERKRLNAIYAQLVSGDSWPIATAARNFSAYNFSCRVMSSELESYTASKFTFIDYKGGLLTDIDEDLDDSYFDFQEEISNADAVILLIDGQKLYKFMQDRDLAKNTYILSWLHRDLSNTLQLAARSNKVTPVYFVITKWDILDGHYSLLEIRECLDKFSELKKFIVTRIDAGCPVRLIPISSVGKTFSTLQIDGSMKKTSGGIPEPWNLEIPLIYILIDKAFVCQNKELYESEKYSFNLLVDLIVDSLERTISLTPEERRQRSANVVDEKTALSCLVDTFVSRIKAFEEEFPNSNLGGIDLSNMLKRHRLEDGTFISTISQNQFESIIEYMRNLFSNFFG